MKRALIILIGLITLNVLPAAMVMAADPESTDDGEIKVYLEAPLGEADGHVISICTPYCITQEITDSTGVKTKKGVGIVTQCSEEYPTGDNPENDCKNSESSIDSGGILMELNNPVATTDLCNKLINEDNPPKITTSCRPVQIISGSSGMDIFSQYISLVFKWASGIVGMVAVVVIIISGIQIAVAGSDTGQLEEAKKRIFQSIAGIVVLFLSAIILYIINPNFFGKEETKTTPTKEGAGINMLFADIAKAENSLKDVMDKIEDMPNEPKIPKPETLPGPSTQENLVNTPVKSYFISKLIPTLTKGLVAATGGFAFIMLIIGGIRYITAYGAEEAQTSAKNMIIYSIVGLLIATLSYAIVSVIVSLIT